MSEASPEGGNTSGETPAADEFKAITSQEELNEALKDRLARERSKFKDYNDLKAKAAEFDKLQAANLSEAEKAQARIAELETEMNAVRRDSMRLKIATEHGITDADDIDLFLTGSDEETLAKQAKRLAERQAKATDDEAHETVADSLDLGTRGGTPKKGKSTADLFAAAIDGSFTH